VPFALGTLVGYGNKLRILATICLVLAVTASILFTLYSLSVAGLFCGVVLAGIFFGPILLGGLVGLALRSSLKHATWFEQRDWLVPVLILAIPVVWSVIEGRPANTLPIETVRTSRVIPVTPRAAWDSLMTYEEVTHAPPLLLRLELPQPLRVEGDLDAVGASRKCVYTDGFLVKRVVERTPESSLVFEVTEQAIETHDSVTLIDGGFAFEPHPSGTTVTLTTRYRPHLAPRFIWRPVEALVVRTLHAHVIEGIRIEAESSNAVARAPVR
jgi:hypothetical protein